MFETLSNFIWRAQLPIGEFVARTPVWESFRVYIKLR